MNELKDLELDEVSLVDAGANPAADVVLFKRKAQKSEQPANAETLAKNEEATLMEIEKILSDEAQQAPADEQPVVKAEQPAEELPKADVLVVEKSGVEELAATLKTLTAKLNAHIEKAEDAEFKAIAAKYEILGQDADKLAQMLKRAKHEAPAMYDTAIKVLDGALEAVKKAGTFEEIGRTGCGSADSSQIEKIAAEIQKANPTLSYRQAIDKAFQQHPELKF